MVAPYIFSKYNTARIQTTFVFECMVCRVHGALFQQVQNVFHMYVHVFVIKKNYAKCLHLVTCQVHSANRTKEMNIQ